MNSLPWRSPSAWRKCLVCFIATIPLAGCYGVTTQHYFAATDLNAPDPELTFYRVTVNAESFLMTSQYNAGFFDADALHQLFGEVKPKSDSSPPKTLGTLQLRCDAKGSCEEGGGNDRFTVIYGGNADAVADQIRLFAESDSLGKQIGALLGASASADSMAGATAAEQNAAQTRKNGATLAGKLKSVADEIAVADTPEKARQLLLRAAQEASKGIGSSVVFDTSDVEKGFVQAEATYEALSK